MGEIESDYETGPGSSADDLDQPRAQTDASLTFRRYQHQARATAGHHSSMAAEVTNWALGLSGEAGEVANEVKKHVFHAHPLDAARIKDECSDVLWYLAMLCQATGLELEEVARHNLRKLEKRYPLGFSPERSRNRDE